MADPVPTKKLHDFHTRRDGGCSLTVRFVDLSDGNTLEVQICTECHMIFAKCDHHKCTWGHLPDCDGADSMDPDKPCEGCQLTCDFCGIDGT